MSSWFIKSNQYNEAEQLLSDHIKADQPFYSSIDYLIEKVNDHKLIKNYLSMCIKNRIDVYQSLLDKITDKELLKEYLKVCLEEDLTLPKNAKQLAKEDKQLTDMFNEKYPDFSIGENYV